MKDAKSLLIKRCEQFSVIGIAIFLQQDTTRNIERWIRDGELIPKNMDGVLYNALKDQKKIKEAINEYAKQYN